MRRAKRALGQETYEYTSWWKAHRKARGLADFEMSDEDRKAWKEALAARYADRIAKAWGQSSGNHPESLRWLWNAASDGALRTS